MEYPVLQLRDFGYAYPEEKGFVCEGVNLEIGPGECHCLVGPTGSGKTTLALATKGLLPDSGRWQGEIALPAGSGVGLVLQNPETQLLAATVGGEVAFGLENLCVAPEQMPGRVRAALAAAGLTRPLDFAVDMLSMGQKYRLLMAAALVMEPGLLVLDEPAAQLDPQGQGQLLNVIRNLKNTGVSFLLCEHHPERFAAVVDACWRIDAAGQVRPFCLDSAVRATEPRVSGGAEEELSQRHGKPATPKLVEVRELSMEGAGGEALWTDLSFAVSQGERVAICGPNGAGKTTLLRCLTGFVRPLRGEIRICGTEPRPEVLRGHVGCLFQNPAKQLFESTVREEVAFSLKALPKDRSTVSVANRCSVSLKNRTNYFWTRNEPLSAVDGERDKRVWQTLSLCGIETLADHSPHKLSYGQKHLVALASVLAHEPDLLLLDDPFAGLDPQRTRAVLELLLALSEEQGTTIVLTTHDPRTVPDWVDRVVRLDGERC